MGSTLERLDGDPGAPTSAEVLLLDGDEFVREGLRKLLVSSSGLVVMATGDEEKALALMAEKHFDVAVVDIDTPSPEGGLFTLAQMKRASPATAVLLLCGRQTFDLAVRGFRAGAADVVAKTPENVQRLVDQVVNLARESRRADERDGLLRETLEVHEQFLKRLMDACRKACQAEEMAKGQSEERFILSECSILVVDENPRTAVGLQEALGKSSAYRCTSVTNGGEALDHASQHKFHMALVCERLPDLPWGMVVKTLRAQAPESIVMVFSHPGTLPGRVVIAEENRDIDLVPQLDRPEQLVEAIHQVHEGYMAKARERHYLQAFRAEHLDFLKRYGELRQKLTALLPRTK